MSSYFTEPIPFAREWLIHTFGGPSFKLCSYSFVLFLISFFASFEPSSAITISLFLTFQVMFSSGFLFPMAQIDPLCVFAYTRVDEKLPNCRHM